MDLCDTKVCPWLEGVYDDEQHYAILSRNNIGCGI